MKARSKKLSLNKITIRNLDANELSNVGGGALQNAVQSELKLATGVLSCLCIGFQVSL